MQGLVAKFYPIHMDIQPDPRSHQLPFRSELDGRSSSRGWTGDQLGTTKERTLFQSSALDKNVPYVPLIHPRKLPPLLPHQSAASQHAPQRALVPHSTQAPPLSTLPKQHLSGPVHFNILLDPLSQAKTGASGRQHDGKGTGYSHITSLTATSPQPPVSTRERPLGDSPRPSISNTYCPLPSANCHQHSGQETHSRPTMPMAPILPVSPTSMRKNALTVHASSPPRNTSPPSALPQVTSAGEPQSFHTSFTSGEKWLNAPKSGAPGQIHYQMMTMGTDKGLIQVPVEVGTTSKVAGEKRKRDATASYQFRERRKAKERETQELKQQVRELTEDKDFYQQRCKVLLGIIQQSGISLPPQPSSPARKRRISLSTQLYQDNKASAPKYGKKRRTKAYTQAMPSVPSYIYTTTVPSEYTSTTTKNTSVSAMPSLSQPSNTIAPHYI